MLDLETFKSRASRIYSASTLRRKLYVLKLYDEFLSSRRLTPSVESLALWMDELGRTVDPSSIGVYARDVLSYFDIMLIDVDERKLRSLKMMIPRVSLKQAEYLSVEEVRRLIDTARYPYKLIYALAYSYARRLGEVLGASVDLEAGTVTFPILKRRSGETATFTLEPWIKGMIEEYIKPYIKEYIIGKGRLFYLTPRAVEIAFKRDCVRAGIEPKGRKLRVHMLRHARTTHLMERGVPLEIISKTLVRHVNIGTTFQFYSAPTEKMAERIPRADEILFGGVEGES